MLCVLLCRTLAFAYDVPVTSDGPIIDGALGEWGWAPGIDISPAGDGVGLRGAFEGDSDHWADVYLMWDADSLYIAVSVIDNVLDVEHIDAGDNEWKGFAGERKDKMFYFDHLKVFLRGPEQPLGFNLWVAPELEGAKAYAWGGQQRGAVSDTLPLRVASMVKGNTYSYELALPWTWLRLYPEPDMELDALFLLPDSDLPGLKLSKKVVQSNKWIWWKGKVVLRGKPPGLKKPPEPEIAKKIAEHQRQIIVPKVKVNKPAVAAPLTEQEGEQGDVVSASNAVQNANVVETPAEGEAAAGGEVVESAPRAPADLRARLSRQRLARTQALGAPAWVRQLDTDGDLSTRQIDSLYYRLGETLQRLSQENISSRSDGLIMDMAEYAGTWRAQAKVFVVDLLQATLADLDVEAGRVRPAAARAALATKIEEKKVVTFVRGLCAESLKVYGGNKVVATGDLVEKARRKARLSREEMQRLLQALVNEWQL
ncbi:MAG: hypothetical protein ACI906_000669 [Candidatus Latescibacterota bacterium]